jgi:hypothetical protein
MGFLRLILPSVLAVVADHAVALVKDLTAVALARSLGKRSKTSKARPENPVEGKE